MLVLELSITDDEDTLAIGTSVTKLVEKLRLGALLGNMLDELEYVELEVRFRLNEVKDGGAAGLERKLLAVLDVDTDCVDPDGGVVEEFESVLDTFGLFVVNVVKSGDSVLGEDDGESRGDCGSLIEGDVDTELRGSIGTVAEPVGRGLVRLDVI